MEECQEPRCHNPAVKKWGGRNICQDHFDQYEEQHFKNIHEMHDAY